MFKAASRVLLIALMLITFVGQAIAFNSAMSCQAAKSSPNANASVIVNEQVKHNKLELTAAGGSEDCCGIECCDLDCTCVANACSSFMYVETGSNTSQKLTLNEVACLQPADQPTAISTLLYRPPIFIS